MARWSRVLMLAVAACGLFGQKPPAAREGGPVADTPALIEKGKKAATGLNEFGAMLAETECGAKPRENVFISPLSVYLALAMTEGGAAGKTRAAMRHALAVPEAASDQEMHEAAS